MKRLDINDLKNLMIEFEKEKNVNFKQASILTIVYLVIVIGFWIIFVTNYSWFEQRIKLNPKYDVGTYFVIMIIAVCLFAIIYGFFMSKLNNGRTVFAFEHNCKSEEEINNRMHEILKKLKYKEKKIKGEKVFYAYKNSYSLYSSKSEKRCIKYTIEDNKIIIYVWALAYGNEIQISKSLMLFPTKDTLLHDLYQIYNYINE